MKIDGGDSLELLLPGERDLANLKMVTFRYPLKSLWFGGNGGGGNARRGTAVDDAVLVESGERSSHGADVGMEGEAENSVGLEGQNRNWMFKILHLRTGMKEEELQEKDSNGEVFGVLEKELVADEETDEDDEVDGGDDDDEWCDACRVDFDELEKEIEIDRDTFSGLLHRVSLEQAKLYAKMAYLGNLAYAISEIKVHCFHMVGLIHVIMKIFSCLMKI